MQTFYRCSCDSSYPSCDFCETKFSFDIDINKSLIFHTVNGSYSEGRVGHVYFCSKACYTAFALRENAVFRDLIISKEEKT